MRDISDDPASAASAAVGGSSRAAEAVGAAVDLAAAGAAACRHPSWDCGGRAVRRRGGVARTAQVAPRVAHDTGAKGPKTNVRVSFRQTEESMSVGLHLFS